MEIENYKNIQKRALKIAIENFRLDLIPDICFIQYGIKVAHVSENMQSKLQIKNLKPSMYIREVILISQLPNKCVWFPAIKLQSDDWCRIAITTRFYNSHFSSKTTKTRGCGFLELDGDCAYFLTKDERNGRKIHYSEF